MKPVSPVVPEYDMQETKFEAPGCDDLPVIMDDEGGATSRWLLTPEEIAQVVKQGYIYVHQRGASKGVQPIWIGVDPPIKPNSDGPDDDAVLSADEISFGG